MIPAVVGFRWDIEDEQAREYTEKFYTHLFHQRSIESAFFEARKEMHDARPKEPIWASPVLVVQI